MRIDHNNRVKLVVLAVLLSGSFGCVSRRYVVRDSNTALNSWSRLEASASGTPVDVRLHSGMLLNGRLAGLDAQTIALSTSSADVVRIAKSDIQRITAGSADTLAEGAVIGGLAGALLGLLALQGAREAGDAGMALGVNTGFFAALGVFLDWRHQEREVLYAAPE